MFIQLEFMDPPSSDQSALISNRSFIGTIAFSINKLLATL